MQIFPMRTKKREMLRDSQNKIHVLNSHYSKEDNLEATYILF